MSGVVERRIKTSIPTEYGDFDVFGYEEENGKEHIALVKGKISATGMLCRMHSECLTGEVFGSLKCDCKEQLEIAFYKIAQEERGIILYLRQEGRGIGLIEKLKAYQLQQDGKDTVEANLQLGHQPDERDYKVAVTILKDLGVESVRLMTNNPDKMAQIKAYGVEVEERVSVEPTRVGKHNKEYLQTKIEKMQHLIDNV